MDIAELNWDITVPTKPKKKPSPGPGSYNSHFYGSIGYKSKSGVGKRIIGRNFIPHKPPVGPGPAAYNPRLAKNSPAFSLGGRTAPAGSAIELAYPSPGPGEYNVAGDMKAAAPTMKGRTTIYGDRLLSPQRKSEKQIPGPGAYDYGSTFGSTAPSVTIKCPIPVPPKDGPGPGEYHPRFTDKRTRPAYTFSSRPSSNPLGTYIDNSVPGPAAYNVRSACFDDGEQSTSAVPPGKSFGERNEIASSSKGIPGPGHYDVDKAATTVRRNNGTIAMRGTYRNTILANLKQTNVNNNTSTVPGPGHYDVIEPFGKDAKHITLKPRHRPAPPNGGPGPGQYDVQTATVTAAKHISSPNMARSSNTRLEQHTPVRPQGPGPGHYTPRTALTDKVAQSMGITIKSRVKPREEYNPVGPGEYNVEVTPIPRITIKGKAKHFALEASGLDFPGPGAYHPELYDSMEARTSPRKDITN